MAGITDAIMKRIVASFPQMLADFKSFNIIDSGIKFTEPVNFI